MVNFLIKIIMAMNTFVIRASLGRLGSRLATQNILLLHTVGRRSDKHFITPISYFSMDGYYFLVGSNWGREHNADWYFNLMAQPCTTIEVRGREILVDARQAEGQEYDQLWKKAIQHYPPYQHYNEKTERRIPIIVLQPENK
jgi:deazaflavin-dependent oxidoreductase (nitroreductase family)